MEEWRDVEGYEGLYQVSNEGRVRSLPRTIETSNRQSRTYGGRVIHGCMSSTGYRVVTLSKKARSSIHRLVASAFVPNPDNKPCVNHINGDKTDNRPENLEWCSYSENEKHAYNIGLKHKSPKAGRQRRFTDEQIRTIRQSCEPMAHLARKYGVSETTVKYIKTRRIYSEVEDD